jgi:hypothetical protein
VHNDFTIILDIVMIVLALEKFKIRNSFLLFLQFVFSFWHFLELIYRVIFAGKIVICAGNSGSICEVLLRHDVKQTQRSL